jgi:hypothetical protein
VRHWTRDEVKVAAEAVQLGRAFARLDLYKLSNNLESLGLGKLP